MRTTPIAAAAAILLTACNLATGESPDGSPTGEPTPTLSRAPTPTPTASLTPAPTPRPTPTPFGASVFDDPDSCVNEELDYRVAFPESWYYNTAYADFPACMFFHPEHFAVEGDEPPDTAISFRGGEGIAVGVVAIYTITLHEETEVDGRPAVRWEYRGLEGNPDGPDYRVYTYSFFTTDDHSMSGPSITASVMSANHPDYEENKEVLDGMMETIQIPADGN